MSGQPPRTIRATFVGGPHCGLEVHLPSDVSGVNWEGLPYMRSNRRDPENRQVFLFEHTRKLSRKGGPHGS